METDEKDTIIPDVLKHAAAEIAAVCRKYQLRQLLEGCVLGN